MNEHFVADGCAALAVELIEAALRDLLVPGRAAAATRWIMGGRARLSFADACWCAGLDPDAVRSRLVRDGRLVPPEAA